MTWRSPELSLPEDEAMIVGFAQGPQFAGQGKLRPSITWQRLGSLWEGRAGSCSHFCC